MSDIFSISPDLLGLRVYDCGDGLARIRVGHPMPSNTVAIGKDQARALASALLQWAGSDDPEWGPLIPWFGQGCPLDQWEFDNARIVLAAREDGHLFATRVATSEEWRHAEENPSHVIAYRVRKRPPAPVEEWVPLTVVAERQAVDIEILVRDGKAVDARMAQEGE